MPSIASNRAVSPMLTGCPPRRVLSTHHLTASDSTFLARPCKVNRAWGLRRYVGILVAVCASHDHVLWREGNMKLVGES